MSLAAFARDVLHAIGHWACGRYSDLADVGADFWSDEEDES